MVIYGVGDTEQAVREDHDRKLIIFLERCRERGIKLNKAKLQIRCREITYLGHRVTDEGLKADPEKVEAIVNMPPPEDVKGVRRLCGFVNYLASTEEELAVQCDASDKGLGATLLQNGQPIAFASRALTDTKTRYAPIEKEMLAVVFALNKFDQYVYGRPVTVNSDHKPLEAIAKKPLKTAPKRLQGMLLKAQKNDINVIYKPGTQMYLADTLSRSYITGSKSSKEEFEHIKATKSVPMTGRKKQRIKERTARDEVLQQLKRVILSGWPEDGSSVPTTLTPYYGFRDELAVHDGLIYRGERLVIPKEMKPMMRELAHSSHIGINGCLRRARESMFWLSMNSDIQKVVKQKRH
ncbi:hypothetical protein QZH41_018854 [Actinostola sp. cb2023]|nr:hypothetical protein QZH41_018854 [Actinostola sp. cb2023]